MERVVKVTRNYQVTLPATVRNKLGIKVGDLVKVVYDDEEGVAKIVPLRKHRVTVRLGRKITVEEIERLAGEFLDEATT